MISKNEKETNNTAFVSNIRKDEGWKYYKEAKEISFNPKIPNSDLLPNLISCPCCFQPISKQYILDAFRLALPTASKSFEETNKQILKMISPLEKKSSSVILSELEESIVTAHYASWVNPRAAISPIYRKTSSVFGMVWGAILFNVVSWKPIQRFLRRNIPEKNFYTKLHINGLITLAGTIACSSLGSVLFPWISGVFVTLK